MQIAPTQSNVQAALRQFILNVLPATASDGSAIAVIAGLGNKVPEPSNASFVVMTPIRFERLSTNVDTSADVKFTGQISGNVLTVSEIAFGEIDVGATVFGTGVASGTTIQTNLSGAGGTGTYQVSKIQSSLSQIMSAGQVVLTQSARVVVQLDFHSEDTTAADNAQTVSTALRDPYGLNFFAGLDPPLNGVFPLFADDPKYAPFVNDQEQYEWRWVLEAHLQVYQTVTAPQQYDDSVVVALKDVSALYPP